MSTHDYAIANASGATVRGDLNTALSAIVSNNSSATAPSPSFANMDWYDSTAAAWKRRNAANTAWLTLATIDQTNGLIRWDFDKGADIASAATTDIGAATGNSVTITGTTTITALGTIKAGVTRLVTFAGALTLTHNATSLILPGGADITTAAGDVMLAKSEGSGNWRIAPYVRADGKAITSRIALETEQATTSGTAFDFTGIPADAKRVTVIFNEVSVTGTDDLLVQLGDSGGIETTGYLSTATAMQGAAATDSATSTAGCIVYVDSESTINSGHMVFTNISGNTWISSLSAKLDGNKAQCGGGSKTLSGTLTQLRLTRTGSNTFDNGTVNILVE